jgi:DNA-binding transcriptional ArsR family regulator
MSQTITSNSATKRLAKNAPLFAALGDETRLTLLVRLGEGSLCSIMSLTQGQSLTRQAIRKHLKILEDVGLVRGVKRGRENLFQIDPQAIKNAAQSLDAISRQWDDALLRLKSFVEN